MENRKTEKNSNKTSFIQESIVYPYIQIPKNFVKKKSENNILISQDSLTNSVKLLYKEANYMSILLEIKDKKFQILSYFFIELFLFKNFKNSFYLNTNGYKD